MLLLDLKDLKLKVPFSNTSPAKCLLTIKHFPRPPYLHLLPQMTRQQPSLERGIQSLFPVALASLGTARLVLDTLKSNGSFVFQMYGRPRGQKSRPAVVVSPDDRIDESCNVFEGKWVWDNLPHPHYTEESCPYLVKQATCQRKGRPDSYYNNWRWQPNDCNLPSVTKHTALKRLVKLDSIANHGKHWEGVDILVFESYVWLMHSPTINATYGSPYVQEYNVTRAYKLALQTWAEWLEKSSMNPERQKVVFMSLSPTHYFVCTSVEEPSKSSVTRN